MKKNAFTMVELLAVIVILGILSTFAIIGVSRLIDRSKEEDDRQNVETLKMAARSYMDENPSKLPKLIGDSVEVSAKELKEKKYIKKDIKNSKGKDCMINSYVNVFKKTKTKYIYTPYLLCGDDKKDTVIQDKPTIELYFIDSLGTEMKLKTYQDVLKNMEKETVYIKMTGGLDSQTGKKLRLEGYSFIVYANYGKAEHEVYNSGTISANEEYEIIEKKKLSDYIDVTQATDFNVKVIAINEKGVRNTVESRKNYLDSKNPVCSGILKGEAAANNWINKADYNNNKKQRSITMICSDIGASGCIRDTFTRTWPNELEKSAEYAYIQVSDNATNKSIEDAYLKNSCTNKDTTNKCRVRVNVDIETPTISLSSNSLTKKYTANDSDSTISIPTTDHKDNYNGWLNKKYYEKGVTYTVDISDNIHLASYVWETNPTNVKATNASNYNSFSQNNPDAIKIVNIDPLPNNNCGVREKKTITISLKGEGMRQGRLIVKDKAGNKTQITIKANIDVTLPTVPNNNLYKWKTLSPKPTSSKDLDKYTSNTWLNGKVFTKPSGSTDNISGLSHYEYITTGATENNTNKTAEYRNIEAEGVSFIKYRAMDKAGNYSDYSDNDTPKIIKLDRTAPNVTVNAYKCNSSLKLYGSKVGSANSGTLGSSSLTGDYDGWLNKDNYPYGVCFEFVVTDNQAIKSKSWSWNKGGYTKNQTGYTTLDGDKSPSSETFDVSKTSGFTTSEKFTHSLSGQGHRYAAFTIKDGAGNSKTVKVSMLIDKTSPTCSVTAKKSVSKTNQTKGTKNYTSGDWSNVAKVYTSPTCTDSGTSGCASNKFKVKVTGAATAGTFTTTERGVQAEKTSYHDWTIYDKAGNSTTCSRFTIKLDRTDPVPSYSKKSGNSQGNGYKNGAVIQRKCTDSISGIDGNQPSDITLSGGASNSPKSISFTCKDNAGNTKTLNKSFTYSANSTCGQYNCNCDDCYYGSNTCRYGCDTCEKNCKKCCWKEGAQICDDWECRSSSPTCDTYDCNCSNCYYGANTCRYGCDKCNYKCWH